jgi:hypothetical protein
VADFEYGIGPLIHSDDPTMNAWAAGGDRAMIDLGTTADCSTSLASSDHRPVAFQWSPTRLPSDFAVLGRGDCREIATDARMLSAWQSATGYRPQGERLVDLLADHLMGGSDPAGLDRCKPLVPTREGDLELWLPGHSLVWSERFEWNNHKHTNKLRDLLRADATELKKSVPQEAYERWLGGLEWKHKQKIAQDIDKDAKPRNPHTSASDNFNGSDSGTLGIQQTWTEYGTFANTSNKAYGLSTLGVQRTARCDADVSSSDQWVTVLIDTLSRGSQDRAQAGACLRFSSSAETCYFTFYGHDTTAPTTRMTTGKIVSTTITVLAGPTSIAFSTGSVSETCKIAASGSTIDTYKAGTTSVHSFTDTAIASGLRGGLYGYLSPAASGASAYMDDYLIDDGIIRTTKPRIIGGGII